MERRRGRPGRKVCGKAEKRAEEDVRLLLKECDPQIARGRREADERIQYVRRRRDE